MLPPKFKKAIAQIKKLEKYDRYLGAFVFGSAARGEVTDDSDLDVIVFVGGKNLCHQINHPFIDDLKLDISFLSQEQIREKTKITENDGRIAMIRESIIVFDKTGWLRDFRRTTRPAPKKFTRKEYQWQKFYLYHLCNKIERHLEENPAASLLVMHASLNDLLKIHYGLRGKWWVSSKYLLADLQRWDKKIANLLRKFVVEADAKKKYRIWNTMTDHIAAAMGGRGSIEENNCACEVCKRDLARICAKTY